jgi:hypothetical protein
MQANEQIGAGSLQKMEALKQTDVDRLIDIHEAHNLIDLQRMGA